MAELRQRQAAQRLSTEQRTALRDLQTNVQAYQRTPRPPRKTNRSLHISISLLILAFFVVYAQQNKPKQDPFRVAGRSLPQWYAVCSKEGAKVYTVPEEGGEGAVECVVVNGKYVHDNGSLGESSTPRGCF